MRYKDFSVSIQVGGESLEEHGLGYEGPERNIMTCWVASQVRKEFIVQFANHSADQYITVTVSVDGRRVGYILCHPNGTGQISGPRTGEETVLPMVFADLQLTDDPAASLDTPLLDELGNIKVVVQRAKPSGQSKPWLCGPVPSENIGPIHERTKKAGVHCVSLGEARVAKKIRRRQPVTHLDAMDSPYCDIRFRYRPEAMLQAQGIIPYVAPPVDNLDNAEPPGPSNVALGKRPAIDAPGPAPRKKPRTDREDKSPEVKKEFKDELDGEDANPEELEEQLRVMLASTEALRARLERAKQNHSRVKREPSPIHLDSSGDVIDLTLLD